ncbi:hypothetical protein FDENT_11248 [Fusarium denticulatum]|uniref:DUF6546 domain-containing protein n=1 Tax=Fusarium denticulatum TaxID=48507 RepID=A0A8H5WPB5_9HYPO|nr:hypothetical protein FDENT_11248 [Fusarium denticulatum]
MANQTTQHHKMRLYSSGCLRWSSLPPETRRDILNTIVDQRNPRWSALASVSKEWQSVIGTRNMAKLNLQPSCLEEFERVVVRQRDIVRHIYLNVDLAEYGCSSCKNRFDDLGDNKNNGLMSTAVHKLLSILSTWKTTNDLTLELNASSASDSKHWFKNFRFNDEHDAPYARDPVIPMEATHSDWHDPKHGWENGVRTKPPPCTANERLFGPIYLLPYTPNSNIIHTPMVNAVTRFMIRRQFHHHLNSVEFQSLLYKFSRICPLFAKHLPETLKRVILFQDSKQYLTESAHQNQDYWASFPSMEDELEPNLPDDFERIAQISLRLDELSVSFFIDAMKFFEACEEEWTWHRLESLSLTSNLLFRGMQCINKLLIAAAKLVLRMPNLTTMVLWNGGTGKACAFMYTRAKHYAHITWRGTWDLEISRQVLEAWEDVAKLHSVELRITHERLRETIRSHGDAIFHLNLPCRVIEPTSLWQIWMEDAQGL